ncbi:MAG: PP2C family protein-serine/threonine phosphatase [Phycisphaerae bacterium]|nr:PP2C family protein-serine/threonine phosphatase [Phycisphaerae bacterium]
MQPRSHGTHGTEAGLSFELQRSESRRADILALVLVILFAFALFRQFFGLAHHTFAAVAATLLMGLFVTAYALTMRRIVRRAIDERRLLSERFWIGSVVFESFLPTLVVLTTLYVTRVDTLDAARSPSVLLYLVFAVAGVLRLRPRLCLVGGVLCAAQDFVLIMFAFASTSYQVNGELKSFLAMYPVLILMAWAVAAAIAHELRRHVVAGMREASTRAELAEVNGELAVAKRIQQRLMPRGGLEALGYEVSGWNRPANQTGGDYFDWFHLPDGRVAISIADVTGHGVGPAIIMAVCRAYARATIPGESSLRIGLGRLNTLLADDVDDGRFVTSAYAILRPATGELELLSAGHGPTLLRRMDGSFESFGGDGPPLGVVSSFEFDPPRILTLGPGDALLLVTDGFLEASNEAGVMFGEARLRSFLALNSHLPTRELLERLDAEVRLHVGDKPQADDMTAVLIRRNA